MVVVESCGGLPSSPSPGCSLPLARLAGTGCLDQLQLTNQSPPSGRSPRQHHLETQTAGFSWPFRARGHTRPSSCLLCHVAFPRGPRPRAASASRVSVTQPSRKDRQERRATASVRRWGVMRSKLRFRETALCETELGPGWVIHSLEFLGDRRA